MGRLFLLVIVIAGAAALLAAALRTTGLAVREKPGAKSEGALMQKTSFLLLVSLIVYVALWGGA